MPVTSPPARREILLIREIRAAARRSPGEIACADLHPRLPVGRDVRPVAGTGSGIVLWLTRRRCHASPAARSHTRLAHLEERKPTECGGHYKRRPASAHGKMLVLPSRIEIADPVVFVFIQGGARHHVPFPQPASQVNRPTARTAKRERRRHGLFKRSAANRTAFFPAAKLRRGYSHEFIGPQACRGVFPRGFLSLRRRRFRQAPLQPSARRDERRSELAALNIVELASAVGQFQQQVRGAHALAQRLVGLQAFQNSCRADGVRPEEQASLEGRKAGSKD